MLRLNHLRLSSSFLINSNSSSSLASYHQTRKFFGVGEVIGILTNPFETLRSLTESKRLLEETRAEILEQKEKASIPPKHTFSPLPGFHLRQTEIKTIESYLSSIPNFTVVFGGTSVGKTALLRQVLTNDRYHVIHFDLRISGFADLSSLFFSLSCQMEVYFNGISNRLEGYDTFEKEALAFKHLRLDIQRKIESNSYLIRTCDVAHLLELFQSCLLKYWEFEPKDPKDEYKKKEAEAEKNLKEWEKIKIREEKKKDQGQEEEEEEDARKSTKGLEESRTVQIDEKQVTDEKSRPDENFGNVKEDGGNEEEDEEKWKPPVKKIPVFFLDEAHKLPMLIKDDEAMKCILDALLVLTKQDRLCHVVHATSDPFYMHWLREMNVLSHCTIITIGDTSKSEAKHYFNENLINNLNKNLDRLQPIDEKLKGDKDVSDLVFRKDKTGNNSSFGLESYELDFELVYKTFGGKLAHIQAFVGDYLNSDRRLRPEQSSQFLQAYSLLQHHLVTIRSEPKLDHNIYNPSFRSSSIIKKHPTCSIKTINYSRLCCLDHEILQNLNHEDRDQMNLLKANDLLYVISKFFPNLNQTENFSKNNNNNNNKFSLNVNHHHHHQINDDQNQDQDEINEISYFKLCKIIDIQFIDQMIKSRILDLRWTQPLTLDYPPPSPPQDFHRNHTKHDVTLIDDDDDDYHLENCNGFEPVLIPISPVMKSAMRKILIEHLSN